MQITVEIDLKELWKAMSDQGIISSSDEFDFSADGGEVELPVYVDIDEHLASADTEAMADELLGRGWEPDGPDGHDVAEALYEIRAGNLSVGRILLERALPMSDATQVEMALR